jgi:hypothetical protein
VSKGTRFVLTGANALDSDGLWALCAWGQRLLGRVKTSVEKSVNERGFSEARLAFKIQLANQQ